MANLLQERLTRSKKHLVAACHSPSHKVLDWVLGQSETRKGKLHFEELCCNHIHSYEPLAMNDYIYIALNMVYRFTLIAGVPDLG